MLDILTDIVTLASALGLFGAILARWIPNEKLHGWGLKSGQFLDNFGSARVGKTMWEKIEDFLVNSVGEYLRGVKDGLDSNEEQDE